MKHKTIGVIRREKAARLVPCIGQKPDCYRTEEVLIKKRKKKKKTSLVMQDNDTPPPKSKSVVSLSVEEV